MRPFSQHLQVLSLAFRHDFDLATWPIAHPSGNCEIFRLLARGKAKSYTLYASTNH